MSQENVEAIREFYDAWRRGDMAWILERSDPAIEIVQPPEVPDSKTYRGHAGVIEAFEDWPSQWDEWRFELVEVIDVDEIRVISVSRHDLRARGIEMQQEVAYLHMIERELAVRVEMYFTRDQALVAAGLPE
jgi:ketosteroid isomerase-like protein